MHSIDIFRFINNRIQSLRNWNPHYFNGFLEKFFDVLLIHLLLILKQYVNIIFRILKCFLQTIYLLCEDLYLAFIYMKHFTLFISLFSVIYVPKVFFTIIFCNSFLKHEHFLLIVDNFIFITDTFLMKFFFLGF